MNMRRILLTLFALCSMAAAIAQTAKVGNVNFKFYGRIRADLFYNSRANEETVDGLFYMYPKDHSYDADGNELVINPGQTWVCTVLEENAKDTVIE